MLSLMTTLLIYKISIDKTKSTFCFKYEYKIFTFDSF